MEHNDIGKLFQNELVELSPDHFPFEESAWDKVEATLNAEGILMPTSQSWKGAWLFALTGLLLLSNLFVGWKYWNAEKEITSLHQTITTLESTAPLSETSTNIPTQTAAIAPVTTTPTEPEIKIVERIVEKPVERIIEKIVYVPVNTSEAASITNSSQLPNNASKIADHPSNDGAGIHPTINPTAKTTSSNPTAGESEDGEHSKLVNVDAQNQKSSLLDNSTNKDVLSNLDNHNAATTKTDEKEKNEESEIAMIDLLATIPLTALASTLDTLNTSTIDSLEMEEYKRKLSVRDYLSLAGSYVTLSNYEIGLSNGYDFLHQSTDFSHFYQRYGLTTEAQFSDYIKIGANIEWRNGKANQVNIENANHPDEYFDVFPSFTGGLQPDDKLTKIEYYDKAIEFALFAKYLFLPTKTWTPYIGLGIRGEYDYEQRFEYKYLAAPDFTSEYELDYVYFYNKQFGFNTLTVMTGFEVQLNSRFALRVDGAYNYDYKAHRYDNSQLQWFSGNAGLLYKFKKTPTNSPYFR